MLTNATSVTSLRNLATTPAAPDDVEEQRRSRVEIAVWSILLVLIMMASLVGNMFVIACVRLHHRLREERANIFLVNLSVTDMCSAALVKSGSLLSMVSDGWKLGSVWCDIVCGANYTLIVVSMMTMCFISLDRYAAVIHALRYHDKVTSKMIYMLLAFAWFQGLCFGAAPIYARWIKYDYWELVCAIEWNTDHHHTLTYVIVAFTVCFLSPGVVMVVASCKVMKVANAHNNVHLQNLPGRLTDVSELTDFPTTDGVRFRGACSASPPTTTDSTGDIFRAVASTGINFDASRLKQPANENNVSPSVSLTNVIGNTPTPQTANNTPTRQTASSTPTRQTASNTPTQQTAVENNAGAQFSNDSHILYDNISREESKQLSRTTKRQYVPLSRTTKRRYVPQRLVRNTLTNEGNRRQSSVFVGLQCGKRTGYKNDSLDKSHLYDLANRTTSVSFSRNINLTVQNEEDDAVSVTIANIPLPTQDDNASPVTKNQPTFFRDSNTTGEIRLALPDIVNHVDIASSSNACPSPASQSPSPDVSLARSGANRPNRQAAVTPAVSRSKRNYSVSSKAVRSLLIVVLAYFVCMTPFSITKLYKVIVPRKDAIPGYVNLTASIFQYCSSAINPLIYGIFRKDFQSAFILLLKKFLLKVKLRDAMDLNLSPY